MRLLLFVLLLSLSLSLVLGMSDKQKKAVIKAAREKGFDKIDPVREYANMRYEAALKFLEEQKIEEESEEEALEEKFEEQQFVEEKFKEKAPEEKFEEQEFVEEKFEEQEFQAAKPIDGKLKRAVKELFKLLFSVVPFRISTMAAAEAFPGYESDVANNVYRMSEHEQMKDIVRYVTSEPVLGVVLLILLGVVYFKFAASIILLVRGVGFVISFGLILAALTDALLDKIRLHVPEKYHSTILAYEKIIEGIAFFAAFPVWRRTNFLTQVILSLAGSALVIAVYHFFEDGMPHTDPHKSFMNSSFVASVKSARDLVERQAAGMPDPASSEPVVPPAKLDAEQHGDF